jgi:hypothetical protein
MIMKQWWNDYYEGKPEESLRKKNMLHCNFVHQKIPQEVAR